MYQPLLLDNERLYRIQQTAIIAQRESAHLGCTRSCQLCSEGYPQAPRGTHSRVKCGMQACNCIYPPAPYRLAIQIRGIRKLTSPCPAHRYPFLGPQWILSSGRKTPPFSDCTRAAKAPQRSTTEETTRCASSMKALRMIPNLTYSLPNPPPTHVYDVR